MRPKLFILAVVTVLLFAACSSSSSPSSVGRRIESRRERPGRQRGTVGQRGGRGLGSGSDHRDGRPVRLALVARGG